MKLVIEINECPKKYGDSYGIRSLLATDEREGDEIYDKISQSGEVARLIELSDKIRETIEAYYRAISSQLIADKNSHTDDFTV